MLTKIRSKVRALLEDILKSDIEVFSYEDTNIFTLSESNISTITKVLINNVETSDYSFDSDTNKITITASGVSSGDSIEVDYTFYKYSVTEIDSAVEASLVWLSIYDYCPKDYELENDSIYPTPPNRDQDLISIISSIIIKPDYQLYRLPNLTVEFPDSMPKEDRITKIITRYKRGLGVNDILEYDNRSKYDENV